jgi:2-dehydropantoate 2-reductase
MLARGDHLAALAATGITITNGPDTCTAAVNAIDDLSNSEKPELVLFAVKTYDTEAACSSLRPITDRLTLVLELQNGVDRAEAIGRLLDGAGVLSGAVYMESQLEGPGAVRYLSGARRIVFGEPAGGLSPRVEVVKQVLIQAAINAEASADMQTELWRKFVLVCAANALTALTRMPFGQIISSPAGRRLVVDIIAEAVAVGRRLGARFDDGAVQGSVAFLESYGPQLRSSMLRDIERGRRVEVDALNGVVVREGERLGLDVPLNRLIWTLLSLHNERVAA